MANLFNSITPTLCRKGALKERFRKIATKTEMGRTFSKMLTNAGNPTQLKTLEKCAFCHILRNPPPPPLYLALYKCSTAEKFEWLVIILTMVNIAKKFTQGESPPLIDFSNNF